MLKSLKIWNEPNNISHWDLELDRGWVRFSDLLARTVSRVREVSSVPLVLGGVSPIDVRFLRLLESRGALEGIDVLAVHGFPMDWNLWPIEEWPRQIERVRSELGRDVWVTETGVSSFICERKAAWAMRRMQAALEGQTVFWYTLLDLAPWVEATTRHKRAEGSGYFRHYHFGLLRHDGSPKALLDVFDPALGICQWLQFQDVRSLELTVRWLERLGVSSVRVGLSWAESHIPGGWDWFDTMMDALEPYEVCATLCFTPPSEGLRAHHTSPPRDPDRFAFFAAEVARRYDGSAERDG